jgi:hypothetical protein
MKRESSFLSGMKFIPDATAVALTSDAAARSRLISQGQMSQLACLGLLALLVLPRGDARATAGLLNDKIERRSRVRLRVPNMATARLEDR